MAGKISPKDIEEVKARTNIADIISNYVQLKPASAGSLKGLCPFHQEKSPSFNVRPLQGFYHCFGCGAGGDVYKFLQEIETLSFYESVELLASKIGYQLNYEAGSASSDSGSRARILEANLQAAKFYQEQLETDDAKTGRDFLKSRGFDKQAAETFGVGFALKGWSSLLEHLKGFGFSEDELMQAGLVSKGDKGVYDRFRGRLIWPIRDASGAVIGFGARKLFEDDKGPKYLNTSETPVYHKSSVLYGIDLAKKEIVKKRQVVVVEGYTDVMACHLAGITTAVATCGTAFGDEHIKILNRLLTSDSELPAEVIFTFDPDEAGQKAAMRAFADSDKFQANSYIAIGPSGLDPSDLRVSQGDQAVRQMIESRRPIYEFAIKQKISNFSLESVEGRVGAARAAASVLAGIKDPAMRSVYLREVANWVNLDVSEVSDLLDRAQRDRTTQAVSNLRVSPAQVPSSPEIEVADLRDPTVRFERQLLEVLIQHPRKVSEGDYREILEADFIAPLHNRFVRILRDNIERRLDPDFLSKIASDLPEEYHPTLRAIAAAELPARNEEELARYIEGVVVSGFINLISRQKLSLQAVLRQLDPTETEKISVIQRELVELESRRRKLQGG